MQLIRSLSLRGLVGLAPTGLRRRRSTNLLHVFSLPAGWLRSYRLELLRATTPVFVTDLAIPRMPLAVLKNMNPPLITETFHECKATLRMIKEIYGRSQNRVNLNKLAIYVKLALLNTFLNCGTSFTNENFGDTN